MSLHEYQIAIKLRNQDVPFYALIMAAMLRADTKNLSALQLHFPEVFDELDERYNMPGGFLLHERGNEFPGILGASPLLKVQDDGSLRIGANMIISPERAKEAVDFLSAHKARGSFDEK